MLTTLEFEDGLRNWIAGPVGDGDALGLADALGDDVEDALALGEDDDDAVGLELVWSTAGTWPSETPGSPRTISAKTEKSPISVRAASFCLCVGVTTITSQIIQIEPMGSLVQTSAN